MFWRLCPDPHIFLAMRPDFWKLHPTLPIFAVSEEGRTIAYTPGHLALVNQSELAQLQSAWQETGANPPSSLAPRAVWLEARAQEAVAAWKGKTEQAFLPECLTLYLSNSCNLACSYCWSRKRRKRSTTLQSLSIDAIRPAAKLVADSCRAKGRAFQLVAHGGGEPTVLPDLLRDAVNLTRSIACKYGIGWQSYLATSGVVDEDQARWLAAHFDRISLSCDGPPDIQDLQRSTVGGGPTSPVVERTAALLRDLGKTVEVRVTITPATMDRQIDIVDYLANVLGARTLRFEPVYSAGRHSFRATQAADFVRNFLAAQHRAAALSVPLDFPGVRLDEVHGAYCQPLRQVLNLTPSGWATACFRVLDANPENSCFLIGHAQPGGSHFEIDQERIRLFGARAAAVPDRCKSCLNAFHCSRACPDFCPVSTPDAGIETSEAALFRCLVAQQLAVAWIRQAARSSCTSDVVRTAAGEETTAGRAQSTPDDDLYHALLSQVPDIVDRPELERAFRQAGQYSAIGKHRMPEPPWRTRPFDFDGPSAWRRLQANISQRPVPRPLSLYVHFPYCDRHCGFCDCLSRPLPPSRSALAETFARRLSTEIQLWAGLTGPRDHPLSTIHFGGGTPNCIPALLFEDIVSQLTATFRIDPETEWALESTTSLLEDIHLDWLYSLGFRRLHVGVQTLDGPLRKTIGRKEDADNVISRLESAIKRGFTVSADLIYGLPGQTADGWISGIQTLLRVPVHGLSLYQLNVSNRNRRFLQRSGFNGPNHLLNYLLFQAAEQVLLDAGYEKRFFNHFSRGEDRNLYSLHASRGEDLVALGPTADGGSGDLIYRHYDLDGYLSADLPAFEGGMVKSVREQLTHPWSVALMSGRIRARGLGALPFAESLLDRWLRHGLLAAIPMTKDYRLTANGSWFISQMIDEVRAAVEPTETR